PPTPSIYPLSLHDALPILLERAARHRARQRIVQAGREQALALGDDPAVAGQPRQLARESHRDRLEIGALGGAEPAAGVGDDRDQDRKSTRLNSSHDQISYA